MILPASSQPALSVAAIRTLESKGLAAGLPLMQYAGRAVASFADDRVQPASRILVLVGPGNNGGDALVAASKLKHMGHEVMVLMPQTAPTGSANGSIDASAALTQCLTSGVQITASLPDAYLTAPPELVIDGLFGIGLSRALDNDWQAIVDQVNLWPVPKLAIDIPSGMDADRSRALGRPIQARWTLSFIAPSLASIDPANQKYFGDCYVDDLGIVR